MKYDKHERRVSTRVNGFELSLLERSGLSNSQIVRYGIRKYFEEHPMCSEHEILTEISFLQDENAKYALKMEANELLIKKRLEELNSLRNSHEHIVYDRLMGGMYDLLLDFMDDEEYSWEIRSDLKEFYIIRRDSISNLGAKFHKTYKETILLFERYLDSLGNDDKVLLSKSSSLVD